MKYTFAACTANGENCDSDYQMRQTVWQANYTTENSGDLVESHISLMLYRHNM